MEEWAILLAKYGPLFMPFGLAAVAIRLTVSNLRKFDEDERRQDTDERGP